MFGLAGILFITSLILLTLKPGLCNGQTITAYTGISSKMSVRACRPRSSLPSSVRNTKLSDADFSTAFELCLGTNEILFKNLRDTMNAFAAEAANKTRKTKRNLRKINHAQNQTSRASILQYVTVTRGKKSLCIGPEPNFVGYTVYELVKSAGAASLYLVTGKNDQVDKVTAERVVIRTTSGEMATVMLGTSKGWRVSVNGRFGTRVVDSREMRLVSGSMNLTLTRQVTKWEVIYSLDVVLDRKHKMGGLLVDALTADGEASFLEEISEEHDDEQACYSLSDDQSKLDQYISPAHKFTPYFMELLQDISHNVLTGTLNKTKTL